MADSAEPSPAIRDQLHHVRNALSSHPPPRKSSPGSPLRLPDAQQSVPVNYTAVRPHFANPRACCEDSNPSVQTVYFVPPIPESARKIDPLPLPEQGQPLFSFVYALAFIFGRGLVNYISHVFSLLLLLHQLKVKSKPKTEENQNIENRTRNRSGVQKINKKGGKLVFIT